MSPGIANCSVCVDYAATNSSAGGISISPSPPSSLSRARLLPSCVRAPSSPAFLKTRLLYEFSGRPCSLANPGALRRRPASYWQRRAERIWKISVAPPPPPERDASAALLETSPALLFREGFSRACIFHGVLDLERRINQNPLRLERFLTFSLLFNISRVAFERPLDTFAVFAEGEKKRKI